jgi:hypothetical protein
MFSTIYSGANLLSFYRILNRRLEGSMRDYLRKRRNCFDHVADISEQSKTTHSIEKSASFNMMCMKSNFSEPIAAISRPQRIHWILNIILYCEFVCLTVNNWRTEHAFKLPREDMSSAKSYTSTHKVSFLRQNFGSWPNLPNNSSYCVRCSEV